jgi:hypothetical protein
MLMPCWFIFLSCGNKSSDSAVEAPSFEAQVTLLSLNDRPQIEISIRSDFDNIELFTEEDGAVSLPVEPEAPFTLTALENNSLQHRYVGYTTTRNFALDALFLDRGTWLSLLGNMGLNDETGHGHLWVSVVNPNFLPIPNATVTLQDSPSEDPFVLLETNVPWATNTIDPTGKPIVFFPNILPQDVSIQVGTPDNMTCSPFVDNSASINEATVTIYANTATILWFVCQ